MWIDEIEDSLPNGFHDAIIGNINVNISKRIISFELDVDVSESTTTDEYMYRKGLLKIVDFGFFIIENPNNSSLSNQSVRITSTGVIANLPITDRKSYFLYLPSCNSFIKFTRRVSDFSWL